ncbi:MAG: replicative DNA helicase, partial [Alphaproteobacteria bacterium]|nr:replicative DNA helicase [Alphaproteobacteria bacterium]
YREEYYLGRESEEPRPHETPENHAKRLKRLEDSRGKAEVIIGKQRHGPIGNVNLKFIGEFTQFSDLALHERMAENRS